MNFGRYIFLFINFIIMFSGSSFFEAVISKYIFDNVSLFGHYLDHYKMILILELLTPLLIALIISSLITSLIGFMGCLAVLKRSSHLMKVYTVLLTIVLITQIIIITYIHLFWEDVEEVYNMLYAMKFRKYWEDGSIRESIDQIQYNLFNCCGVLGPEDYIIKSRMGFQGPMPSSCKIGTFNEATGLPEVYSSGCAIKTFDILVPQLTSIVKVGLTVGFIEIILLAFAFSMSTSTVNFASYSAGGFDRFV